MKNWRPNFSNYLRIPVIFFIFGSLWILLGDRLLGSLTSDVALFLRISTYKGLFFVIATAILLYVLLRLEFTRQGKLENQFKSLFDTAPDLLIITNGHGDILEVNKNLEKYYGYSRGELLTMNILDLLPPDLIEQEKQRISQAAGHGHIIYESVHNRKDGSSMDVEIRRQSMQWHGKPGFGYSIRDITAQNNIQQALMESEERFRQLVNQSPSSIYILQDDQIVFANPPGAQMLGIENAHDLVGQPISKYLSASSDQDLDAADHSLVAGEEQQALLIEKTFLRADGARLPVQVITSPFNYNGRPAVQMIAMDLTKQKQAEADQTRLVRQRDELLEQLQLILDRMPLGCILNNAEFEITLWNPAAEKIFGYAAQDVVGKKLNSPDIPPNIQEFFAGVRERMFAGDLAAHIQSEITTKDGRNIICEWYNTPLFNTAGKFSGFLGMVQDITERRRADDEGRLQLQRLEAMREIGTAITASLDLDITLDILLNHTTNQLQADAAAVLLYDSPTQSLRYVRSRGLRPQSLDSAPLFLGKGYAGQVALSRQMMTIQLGEAETPRGKNHYASEGFKTYIGVPLIAKSQVKGVLELYHRNVLEPPKGWLDYLQIMAEQAAIAIENIQLFENLQRANLDLGLAYDTTIEGWSRALDLRDQGTGDHSRRLANLALELARMLGMSDAQLQHVYRGSLLHDIGKVAVPDSILLKKGPLTDEEWNVMRKHPIHAFELLSPIGYLRPALDIPYCHHEHWDGTGYPRGLRGAEIPLAARIFTVVDVWDALLEDRSYRPAWPREKVIAYLKEQSGKIFDPHVVEIFLSWIQKEQSHP